MFSCEMFFTLAITLILVVMPKVNSQDPALVAITSRVNQIEMMEAITKTNITTLQSRVNSGYDILYSDVGSLGRLIDNIAKNLSQIHIEADANRAAILDAAGKISAIDVGAAEAKITKLQAANEIWIKNFRVVNKTFGELRRKVKFIVPYRLFSFGLPIGVGVIGRRPGAIQKKPVGKPKSKGGKKKGR